MMTVITVEWLQEAQNKIQKGFNCWSVSLEGDLKVDKDAVKWLKEKHYQLKIVETFGPTGVAVVVYPACAD